MPGAADVEARASADVTGHAHRHRPRADRRRLPGRRAAALRRRPCSTSVDAGAEVVEVSCPRSPTRSRPTSSQPERGEQQPGPFDAMRYGLRVAPRDVDDPSAEQVMAATRDAGFGDGGQAPHHPGHLCPRRRLLRRLLRLPRRRFADSSPTTPHPPSSSAPTCWSRPRRRRPPSVWVPRSTTRWRCTSTTSRRSRRTWRAFPDVGAQQARGRGRWPRRSASRSFAPAMADDRLYRVGAALSSASRRRGVGGPLLDRIPDLPSDEPMATAGTPRRRGLR